VAVLQILKGGFIDADGRFTLAYLGALLRDPLYLGALGNSFLMRAPRRRSPRLIALPLAVMSDRFLFQRRIFSFIVLVPMIFTPVCRAATDQANLRHSTSEPRRFFAGKRKRSLITASGSAMSAASVVAAHAMRKELPSAPR